MKRWIVLVLSVALLILTIAPVASAHVHGFTPLGCLTTDNPNSGAAVGFNQAADAAAPMKPANSDGRHSLKVAPTTAGVFHSSQPPSSSVCTSCAAARVIAPAIRNGVPVSVKAAPR